MGTAAVIKGAEAEVDRVETAAPGCPAEQSAAGPSVRGRALPGWTAEGGCPHVI